MEREEQYEWTFREVAVSILGLIVFLICIGGGIFCAVFLVFPPLIAGISNEALEVPILLILFFSGLFFGGFVGLNLFLLMWKAAVPRDDIERSLRFYEQSDLKRRQDNWFSRRVTRYMRWFLVGGT